MKYMRRLRARRFAYGTSIALVAAAFLAPTAANADQAALSVTKTSSATQATRVGDTITYSINVNVATSLLEAETSRVIFNDHLGAILDDATFDSSTLRLTQGAMSLSYSGEKIVGVANYVDESNSNFTIEYDVVFVGGGDGVLENTACATIPAPGVAHPPTFPHRPFPPSQTEDELRVEPQAERAVLPVTECATVINEIPAEQTPETPIENPAPTPTLGECQVEYLGTTVWNRDDRDITDRVKVHNGEISDAVGEVNADGWGSGSTRTLRLYGGTHTELENVRYEVLAVQGFSFNPATVSSISTPGGGALQGNGLTEAIVGATQTEFFGNQSISMSIAQMPAHSSFSFNINAVLDASADPLVIHHRLVGDDPNCEPAVPIEPETPPVDPVEPPAVTEEPPVNNSVAAASTSGPQAPKTALAETGSSMFAGLALFAVTLLASGGTLVIYRRMKGREVT